MPFIIQGNVLSEKPNCIVVCRWLCWHVCLHWERNRDLSSTLYLITERLDIVFSRDNQKLNENNNLVPCDFGKPRCCVENRLQFEVIQMSGQPENLH